MASSVLFGPGMRLAAPSRSRNSGSVTHFRRLAVFGTTASLLECRLETGRTHQIRVHMAHIGHPLLGDPVYLRRLPAAARALPDVLRRPLAGFPRQALHAALLAFPHPRTGEARIQSAWAYRPRVGGCGITTASL